MVPCRVFLGVIFCAAILFMAGCGSTSCQTVGLNVTPQSATVDHTAAAPANGQVFSATPGFSAGCAGVATAALASSNWAASDPTVKLSSTLGPQVTATCTTVLPSPVTITATSATGQALTGQASLVCQ